MSKPNIDVLIGGPKNEHSYTYKEVILKENLPLSQQMVEKNRKYVVKWNFDLNGETVTVPEGCLLEFDGGSISNGTIVGNNTIMIYNKPIDEVCLAERQGTFIYNATVADEEDITSESGKLKFKDRPATNGMGRKILRKNIVDGINTLTQEMMSDANTIYIIQYDFTLGENITIPAGCILEFEGGSLSNATIVGQNTCIEAGLVKIFNTDVTIVGTWNVAELYPEWFGAKGDGVNDDTEAIQKAFDVGFSINLGNIKLCNTVYNISEPIVFNHQIRFKLSGIKTKHIPAIKAVAAMECMITSDASQTYVYSYFDCENITLDGNRGSAIFDSSTKQFNQESIALAKNGLYFSYGLIYSKIEDVTILNIDGWAIVAEASWLTFINNIKVESCDYGVYANTANSFKLLNSNFSYIRKYCVAIGSGNPLVQGNSFDVVGEFAIAVGSESKSSCIRNNYFETCSITGKAFTTRPANEVTELIHTYIVITGVGIASYLKGNYGIGKNYPCSVYIENNYIDSPETADNKYFVIAGGLYNSTIKNTVAVSSDADRVVLGVILDSDATDMHDIEITGNIAYGSNTFLKKIKVFHTRNTVSSASGLYNICSNDTPESAFYCENIINHVYIVQSKPNVIKEENETYKGNIVLSCALGTYIAFKYSASNINIFDPSLIEDRVIFVTWYSKADANSEWVFNSLWRNGSVDISIGINSNSFITLPKIFIAGENYHDSEFMPVAVGDGLIINSYLHLKPNREIKVVQNSYVDKAHFIYPNNDINESFTVVAELKSTAIPKASIYKDAYYYPNNYRGINVFDETITPKKPIWFNPVKKDWVESDGAIAGVMRRGTFGQKPRSTNIYEGFAYFCTNKQTIEGATDGIIIYYKGQDTTDPDNPVDVWVDALGRVVS